MQGAMCFKYFGKLDTESDVAAPQPYSLRAQMSEQFGSHGYDTPTFSLNGTNTWARVVDVYDGDTITIVLPICGSMYKFHTRIFGIDTSEMKSKIQKNKDGAVCARNRMIQLVTGCDATQVTPTSFKCRKDIREFFKTGTYMIWVTCMDFDKYGRVLVNIYDGPSKNNDYAQILIQDQLAYPYFGGTKLTEREQEAAE